MACVFSLDHLQSHEAVVDYEDAILLHFRLCRSANFLEPLLNFRIQRSQLFSPDQSMDTLCSHVSEPRDPCQLPTVVVLVVSSAPGPKQYTALTLVCGVLMLSHTFHAARFGQR